MGNSNVQINLSAIMQTVAAAALIGIGTLFFAMRSDFEELRTDVAVMKESMATIRNQMEALIDRDIPTRSEVRALVENAAFPWLKDRPEWIKWQAEVNQRLKVLEAK